MKLRVVLALVPCLFFAHLNLSGCAKKPTRGNKGTRTTKSITDNQRESSEKLIRSIAATLNRLPHEIVLELAPPQPIVDDSKSTDGKEIRATCNVTPAVPDGPYNYLEIPSGNVDLKKLGVGPGDIVRYFRGSNRGKYRVWIEKRDLPGTPSSPTRHEQPKDGTHR